MHCSVSSAVQGLRWNYRTPPQGSGPRDGRLRAALEERKAMGRKEGKVVQELVMATLDSVVLLAQNFTTSWRIR